MSDRDLILDTIKSCTCDKILITHGTYTIAETGSYLKQNILNDNKIIFLVGAWIPFNQLNSDAPIQMFFALNNIRRTKPGVYIAMDNKLWNPDTTVKIQDSEGIFKLKEIVV